MDHLLVMSYAQDLWSIIALFAVLGPPLVFWQKNRIIEVFDPKHYEILKKVVFWVAEYVVVLQFCIFLFPDIASLETNIIFGDSNNDGVISGIACPKKYIILFSSFVGLLFSCLIWVKISEEKRESWRIVLRWIALFSVLAWLGKNRLDIHSFRDFFACILAIIDFFKTVFITVVNFLSVLGERFHIEYECEVKLLAALIPVHYYFYHDIRWYKANIDRNVRFIFSLICHTFFSFYLLWILFSGHIHSVFDLFVLDFVIFLFLLIRFVFWYKMNKRTRKWMRRSLKLSIGLALVIHIFQVYWGIDFMAAARRLFQVVFVRGVVLLRGSVFGKWFVERIGAILVATESGIWLRGAWSFIWKKVSVRLFVKVGFMVVILQIFSFKSVKRYIRSKTGKVGEIALQKAAMAKEKWFLWTFWTKFFIFFLITYLLWVSPWDIFWPMLPNGATKAFSILFKGISKLFLALAKKLFGNTITDKLMIFFARFISKKISNLSPQMKRRGQMFMKWKVGKFMIKNKHRFVFLEKEFRDASRKERQKVIFARKNADDLGIAGVTAATIYSTGKVATRLAKEGLLGTASFAFQGVEGTLNFAQKKTIISWMLLKTLTQEVIQYDKPTDWHKIQNLLRELVRINKLKDEIDLEALKKERTEKTNDQSLSVSV